MRIVVSFYRTGSPEISQRIFLNGTGVDLIQDPITKEEFYIVCYSQDGKLVNDKWRVFEVIGIELF